MASFVAAIVSVPPPPAIEPEPVQPLTVNVLLPAPPVRFAAPMPERDMLSPSPAASDVLPSTKLAFLAATTVSDPPPPTIEPEPVQPLTVNALASGRRSGWRR